MFHQVLHLSAEWSDPGRPPPKLDGDGEGVVLPMLTRWPQRLQSGEALTDLGRVLAAQTKGMWCTLGSLANGESGLPTASVSLWS